MSDFSIFGNFIVSIFNGVLGETCAENEIELNIGIINNILIFLLDLNTFK